MLSLMTSRRLSRFLLLPPLTLYALSFFLPAMQAGADPSTIMTGWKASRVALVFFWEEFAPALVQPCRPETKALLVGLGWLPNPLFLTAVCTLALGRPRQAGFTALAALGLALLWPAYILPIYRG